MEYRFALIGALTSTALAVVGCCAGITPTLPGVLELPGSMAEYAEDPKY